MVKGRFALLPLSELHLHEQSEPERVRRVMKQIQASGIVKKAIVVDGKTKVVLDGVHRFTALKMLGAVRVPAWVVDYSDKGVLVYSKDRKSEIPKDVVIRAAMVGPKLPPKTTRHLGKAKDGRLLPLSDLEDDVSVPLLTLLQPGR